MSHQPRSNSTSRALPLPQPHPATVTKGQGHAHQAVQETKHDSKESACKDEDRKSNTVEELPKYVYDSCWPDHACQASIVVDDVSQFNATPIARLIEPLTEDDVFEALEEAVRTGKPVIARGTKHSMGGQSIAKEGTVLDMRCVDHVIFDSASHTVRCGSGAQWSAVIAQLNRFGKAPRTLQSYCTFSVGGTVSVNAHGITSDFAVGESITFITLLRLGKDGARERLILTPQDELFHLAIGGFGLFGVIYDVTMKVVDNVNLWMESMHCKPHDFPYVYEGILQQPDVKIKLSRIDITNFDHIAIYVFRSDSTVPCVSALPIKPREMSNASALIYKWLAGPLLEARFAAERSGGLALDWAPVSTANELLYESAVPMGRLYSPILAFDDTFLLQEYFVPAASFTLFYSGLRDLVTKIRSDAKCVTILNVSIRYVRQDTVSALPYASTDSYAFVLYFRLRRTREADEEMRSFHLQATDLAIQNGGTFYLPYRHHYTDQQLRASYPQWDAFVARKLHFDHFNMFTNLWWERYGKRAHPHPHAQAQPKAALPPTMADGAAPTPAPVIDVTKVDIHRTNSFRALLKSHALRTAFAEDFLQETLTQVPSARVMSLLCDAMHDIRNQTDDDIYQRFTDLIKEETASPMGQFFFLMRSIQQAAAQRAELTREVVSVVSRLGLLGLLHDYCSIGDQGKLCLSLKKALKMHGRTVVANDDCGDADNIAAVIERCSLTPVGDFERVDFSHIRHVEFPGLAANSFDLVTMNQGLHHLPPAQLGHFLEGVHRILRPGGLFITREHDMRTTAIRPMLDCAHMVFNAVTGVSPLAERSEIRGFRSVLEWRAIVENMGFTDTKLYELQPNDCTVDVMMTFRKRGKYDLERPLQLSKLPVAQAPATARVADALPRLAMSAGLELINSLLVTLPQLRRFLIGFLKILLPNIPGFTSAIESQVERTVDGWLEMLERFAPLASHAKPASAHGPGVIPEEFFLLIPVFRARAKKGGVVEAIIVDIYEQIMSALQAKAKKDEQARNIVAVNDRVPALEFDQAVQSLLKAIPTLSTIEAVVAQLGISDKASTLLLASLTQNNLRAIREFVLRDMDGHTWQRIKLSLAPLIAEKRLPTLQLVLQRGSAWNRFATAVLGWEDIQPTWAQTVGLQAVGLSELVHLWRGAPQQCKVDAAAANAGGAPAPDKLARLQRGMEKITPSRTFHCKMGLVARLPVLEGVLCIDHAEISAQSLTRLLNDKVTVVTDAVAEALQPETGELDLNEVKLPHSWRAGSHTLTITYRAIPNISPAEQGQCATDLIEALDAADLVDSNWRSKNAILTYLSLSEWMTAECIQMFGNSLDHTPFYRFPFMEYCATYRSVLLKETRLVASLQGWFPTLLSDMFLTDLFGGVVLHLGFAALNLVSLPIKMQLGESYPANSLKERLLIVAPRTMRWSDTCGREHILESSEAFPGIWTVTVPTFKGLAPALCKIASAVPSAVVLRVSNNPVIQLRLQCKVGSDVSALRERVLAHPGTELASNFQYPQIGQVQNPEELCVLVRTIHLLSFLRELDSLDINGDISVHHAYGFYNYET